jgi:hypothetical protein
VSALGLQRASAAVAMTLEGLCDHDLAEPDREEGTEQLYAALADVRLELTKLGEGADADALDPERVVRVAEGRWRRRGWGRRPSG